jgi:hypothetical protein
MSNLDKTLRDINRRAISVNEKKNIDNVLPEYFHDEYPKFSKFIEEYYHFHDSDGSPAKLVDDLFLNRDIRQVDIDLLSFIEDELLLGQQYFEGFQNKRAAANYSSTLYKSKGTKYSIQQFFRVFYNIPVEVEYTKENVFIVGNVHDLEQEKANQNAGITPYAPVINISASKIGPDSRRFLTNDRLYQQYALLIKTALPLETWKDIYKLFVHPAGMFLGAEVQIISEVLNPYVGMPDGVADSSFPITEGTATATMDPVQLSYAVFQDVGQSYTTVPYQLGQLAGFTLFQLGQTFDELVDMLDPGSQTFDEDSAIGDSSYPRFDIAETMINFSTDHF